jgi:Transposase
MTPGGLNAEEQIQRTSDHPNPEGGGSRTDGKGRLSRTLDQRSDQWKSKYGGMQASDIKRLRELEKENRRLKTDLRRLCCWRIGR